MSAGVREMWVHEKTILVSDIAGKEHRMPILCSRLSDGRDCCIATCPSFSDAENKDHFEKWMQAVESGKEPANDC